MGELAGEDTERHLLLESVALTLKRAGAVSAVRELAVDMLVSRLRELLGAGPDFDEELRPLPSPEYLRELGLSPTPSREDEVAAVLDWYVHAGAVTAAEADAVRSLIEAAAGCRSIATAVLDPRVCVDVAVLAPIADVVRAVARFSVTGNRDELPGLVVDTPVAELIELVSAAAHTV